jgi:ketosteroid isomerase-like protein
MASAEHGVALARVLAERPGRELDVNVAYVCHVKDGRIPDLWEIPADQTAWDAFWS